MPARTPKSRCAPRFLQGVGECSTSTMTCAGISPSTQQNRGRDSSRDAITDADPTWVWRGVRGTPLAACLLTGGHAGQPQMPLASLRYSVWCLVATKTTVWSWGFTTFRSRWSSTAGLSSPRTWKKASCKGRAELSPSVSPRPMPPPLLSPPHKPGATAGWLAGGGGRKAHLEPPPTASPSHLELLAELGFHIQTDQHRLGETCGTW